MHGPFFESRTQGIAGLVRGLLTGYVVSYNRSWIGVSL
jgi:hypothetical protein